MCSNFILRPENVSFLMTLRWSNPHLAIQADRECVMGTHGNEHSYVKWAKPLSLFEDGFPVVKEFLNDRRSGDANGFLIPQLL